MVLNTVMPSRTLLQLCLPSLKLQDRFYYSTYIPPLPRSLSLTTAPIYSSSLRLVSAPPSTRPTGLTASSSLRPGCSAHSGPFITGAGSHTHCAKALFSPQENNLCPLTRGRLVASRTRSRSAGVKRPQTVAGSGSSWHRQW